MPRKKRIFLLAELQKHRKTNLIITYFTSVRNGFSFNMAMDQVRFIFDHLKKLNTKKSDTKIDIFLCSNGGDGLVPWKLVNLIREFCSEFNVIIPFRAFSAATLLSLGADNIIMHPMGMLGPTDPTVGNPYNPIDPITKQKIGISVEDLYAYIDLIKKDVGITHDDELIQAFNKLVDKVHPFALGNARRQNSQSEMLATKLLKIHMKKPEQQHLIQEIVDNLKSKLYFHGHPINRKEAKELNLKIVFPSPKEEKLIWELYLEYEKDMNLIIPYDPIDLFIRQYPFINPGQVKNITVKNLIGVIIESKYFSDIYSEDHNIFATKTQEGIYKLLSVSAERKGWKRFKV